MKDRSSTLRLLTSVFLGQLPPEERWPAVLALANRGWLTPALWLAVQDHGLEDHMPADVVDYLRLIHDCNLDRNRRLRGQLAEALGTLNRQDVTPVLLKGAISLVESRDERLGARMMGDLDLAIGPAQIERTTAALSSLGYEPTGPRQFARPSDAGEVELHLAPGGRTARYLRGDLWAQSRLAEVDGTSTLVPGPTARALHLLVHDMIKEGDFLRCQLDLRHLHDLARLASVPGAIDWNHVAAILGDPVASAALDVQLLALGDLFGIRVSLSRPAWRWAGQWHRARLLTAGGGVVRRAIGVGGTLAYGFHRLASGAIQLDARSPLRLVRALAATTRGSRI